MKTNEVDRLAEDLAAVCVGKGLYPFPREDCRKLLANDDKQFENIVTHLDLYFSDIVGYCSWGKRILGWPEEKLGGMKEKLSLSFFEKYPQYAPLESIINESRTPDLFGKLALHEKLRVSLLKLLTYSHP